MLHPSKILIVDDDPFDVDYLELELEDSGYTTVSASNGREALEKVAVEAPDLILLDVTMPIMDGLTACRLLKEDDETRLIPILIMTGLDGFEDRLQGIEAGADDFFTKPVHQRELLARMQTALRLKQTVDGKLRALCRTTDHFAKFVPEAVKRLVAANPEAPDLAKHMQDVSVLFVDITGYTRLCEQLPLEGLNQLVERYFSTFLDQIHAAGGDINETAGDGFMAIFQAADVQAHPVAAVETALALLVATEALNRTNSAPPLTIHMGLNSGLALVGSTRFEGAQGTRWTFTASGPVTNLAARLAATAQAGQLLVGPETIRRLGPGYQVERLGREHLKNLAQAVDIYRVVGPVEGPVQLGSRGL